MNRLTIGGSPKGVLFFNDIKSLRDWFGTYFNHECTIGDVSTFSDAMRGLLLKGVEENDMLSLWSSCDLNDEILLSRVQSVEKNDHAVQFDDNISEQPIPIQIAYMSARIGRRLLKDVTWSE